MTKTEHGQRMQYQIIQYMIATFEGTISEYRPRYRQEGYKPISRDQKSENNDSQKRGLKEDAWRGYVLIWVVGTL